MCKKCPPDVASMMVADVYTSHVCGTTTFRITTLSIKTSSIMTFGITTISIKTFSIMTFRIKGLFATLSKMTFSINDTQHNSTRAIMLSVIMLNVTFYLLLC